MADFPLDFPVVFTVSIFMIRLRYIIESFQCTAVTEGKTPVPVCSPKLSPVGRG